MIFLTMIALNIAIIILAYYLIKTSRQLSQSHLQLKEVDHQLVEQTANEKKLQTEFEALHGQLAENISYDPITHLVSQKIFTDRLEVAITQSKRYELTFGVLILNLDDFKVINAALGHDVGNELLREISQQLQIAIRKVDTVSRFSGDEFVFILPQLTKAEAAAYVARRLLDVVSQPIQLQGQEIFITASIGVAIFPQDGMDAKLLLKNAEIALRQAKAHGRNTYQFYHQEMNALSYRELRLSSDLRRDSIFEEFSLHYQPQVHVGNKKITCMEALLRWQHPDFGLITPQEFLYFLEKSGRMTVVGEWILRSACQQFKKWHQQGFYPDCVSVNISVRQLQDPHFSILVAKILRETELEPACLILEVAEKSLLSQSELTEKTLHMLKHLGVQIAVDDFGTGHLALGHLRRFAIDYLKIDQSLVQEITVNKESEILVKTIIVLGSSLQIKVVAEGVETKKQKELLRELGCLTLQGHLFSIPRPAEDFTQALEKMITESV